MTEPKTTAEEATLWRRAARRLAEVDPEPPLTSARIDALLDVLGPRAADQALRSWLRGERRAGAAAHRGGGALIIPFDRSRQRFRSVERFARLAADSAEDRLQLPERELEGESGRFRLKVRLDDGHILLELQALGFATDEFAGRRVGLASAEDEEAPVAVVALDEDADGSARLPDTPDLRRALLRPVIGVIEEI